MKIFVFLLFGFGLSVLQAQNSHFLSNPYWDSGKAEVQVYQASLNKYGIKRDATVKLIIVREPFHGKKLVKSLKKKNIVDVVKMNYIQKIPAGIYDYYQMASVFFERGSGKVLKCVMSSQDGCGATFVEYLNKNQKDIFNIFSYFDDQGDHQVILPHKDFVFYEALPVFLRFRLNEKTPYQVNMLNGVVSNKAPDLTCHQAFVSNTSQKKLKIGKHVHDNVLCATVRFDGKEDKFYFKQMYPCRLLKWEKHNGDEMVLKKSHHLYYWNFTGPEHGQMGQWDN